MSKNTSIRALGKINEINPRGRESTPRLPLEPYTKRVVLLLQVTIL